MDLQQLTQILGAAGGLRGNRGFQQRWAQLEAEAARKQQLEQQAAAQQEQLGFSRAANARAQRDQELQERQARVGNIERFSGMLGDEAIDTPDLFEQRAAFVRNSGPQVGLTPEYIEHLIRTMRPAPDKYTTRQLRKRLTDLGKLSAAERRQFEQGGMWEIGGQRYTPAQARAVLGQGAVDAQGQPFAFGQPEAPSGSIASDVPLDRQHAMALASGNTALARTIEEAIRRQDAARRDPADPVMAELRQMRLDQMRAAGQAGPQLPAATQRRVDMKTRAFDQQPVVKRIQTMAESVQFAEGLDTKTTNPADDQALIYAFAKAMDPDSVVREGEYATVQKYAQSWAERFGFEAARVFSNTTFLTPQARANMKATIRARFAAARPQYDNLRRSYTKQINQITGQGDGDSYLVDYAAAFPAAPDTALLSTEGRATVTPAPAPPARSDGPGPAAPGANPFRR